MAYWDRQEASYDGVLGGHGHVSDADIRESRAFLRAALGPERFDAAEAACGSGGSAAAASPPGLALTAADCGAGVGRVSEELLLRVCAVVDLVEPSETMIEGARRRLLLSSGSPGGGEKKKKKPWGGEPGQFLRVGLQGFEPAAGRYDVIWVQWAMLYLTDGEREGKRFFVFFFFFALSLSLSLSSPLSSHPLVFFSPSLSRSLLSLLFPHPSNKSIADDAVAFLKSCLLYTSDAADE